jgi:L-serine deaminase
MLTSSTMSGQRKRRTRVDAASEECQLIIGKGTGTAGVGIVRLTGETTSDNKKPVQDL